MSAAPAHALQQAFQTLTSGDAGAAEAQLRAILKQYPEDPDAGFLLGTLLLNLKRAADAIPYLNLAKDARANDPVFRFNMAEALMRTGEDAAAEPHLRALVELNPNDPGHHHKLGLCLSRQGRDGEAESLFEQVTRHPDAPGDWFNDLGLCLQELGRAAEAESAYREAVARLPDQARPIYNLGNMLLDQHRPAEAVIAYDQAIRLSPDLAMAHLHKAYALLMQGDYAAAWPEYEWRWRAGYNLSNWRDFDCPLWDGGPLEGRTLALYAEQGMGDTIQFSRFIAPPHGASPRQLCPPANPAAPRPVSLDLEDPPAHAGGALGRSASRVRFEAATSEPARAAWCGTGRCGHRRPLRGSHPRCRRALPRPAGRQRQTD